LDSKHAQRILREIIAILEDAQLDKYLIVEAKGDGEGNDEYSIKIKAFLSSIKKQAVLSIAEKHGLEVYEDKEGFILQSDVRPKS
jgi:hypothetical protein